MTASDTAPADYTAGLAAKPMASAILFHDQQQRHLLVQPVYKPEWELPGGSVEAGESPHAAAVREIEEELGLVVVPGRLLVIDWVPPRGTRTDGLMIVYDGGMLTPAQEAAVRNPPDELSGWAWSTPEEEAARLSPLLARRAAAARQARLDGQTRYLEFGYPIGAGGYAQPDAS